MMLGIALHCGCQAPKPYPGKAQIDALIDAPSDKPFNGVILIAEKGEPVYTRIAGLANMDRKVNINDHTQFVIGSVSKQFTGVLVLREVDKGHLNLNDPIRKYLPDLTQPWADSVLVKHLVLHMHGIQALDKPLAFAPGTQFNYSFSNLGYNLLSKIVEKTSGKSFAALSDELFTLCDMRDTYHPNVNRYNELAKGYTEQENGQLAFETQSFENSPAAGGFVSNAYDLVKWNECLHNGKLLKPETYTMMITPQENAVRNHQLFGHTTYGYSLTVTTKGDKLQLGQTGFAPGFVSMNYYFPKTGTSVVVLSNTAYQTDDLKKTFRYHTSILDIVSEN